MRKKERFLPHVPRRGILEFGSFHPANKIQVKGFSTKDQNSGKWWSIGWTDGYIVGHIMWSWFAKLAMVIVLEKDSCEINTEYRICRETLPLNLVGHIDFMFLGLPPPNVQIFKVFFFSNDEIVSTIYKKSVKK